MIPRGSLDISSVPELYGGWMPALALNEIEVVRAIFAEALYHTAPELLEVTARATDVLIALPLLARRGGAVARALQRDDTEFLAASGAVAAFVSEPLRVSARAIRAGAVPPDQPAKLVLPPPPPPVPMVNLLLLQPVTWKGREGHIVRGDAWTLRDLPAHIAARAVELGVAVQANTPEAEAYIAARRNQSVTNPGRHHNQSISKAPDAQAPARFR
jgi:hypothetical protein